MVGQVHIEFLQDFSNFVFFRVVSHPYRFDNIRNKTVNPTRGKTRNLLLSFCAHHQLDFANTVVSRTGKRFLLQVQQKVKVLRCESWRRAHVTIQQLRFEARRLKGKRFRVEFPSSLHAARATVQVVLFFFSDLRG